MLTLPPPFPHPLSLCHSLSTLILQGKHSRGLRGVSEEAADSIHRPLPGCTATPTSFPCTSTLRVRAAFAIIANACCLLLVPSCQLPQQCSRRLMSAACTTLFAALILVCPPNLRRIQNCSAWHRTSLFGQGMDVDVELLAILSLRFTGQTATKP